MDAALLCTQRVARSMVEGVRAAPGFAAYAAAKAGVINYTKTAALELAPPGIRVNALAPDITMTEGIAMFMPAGSEERIARTAPMGRAGHVDGGTQAAGGWCHGADDAYVLGPSPEDESTVSTARD